ncbi:hypothetical protein DMB66_06150 [Actinoplanes sp. ATCC 53533]|uniref:isocitrate lyase/phosphoenolpyruvate mutase family protein n=1 Tax=Actinoplanes sp. ATCC 53533 TaxID=1288362 RepID=UPI000F7B1C11|nr:hypothetical protein DMB66_06150 [Actinoplanes sp. ATCC 53533]
MAADPGRCEQLQGRRDAADQRDGAAHRLRHRAELSSASASAGRRRPRAARRGRGDRADHRGGLDETVERATAYLAAGADGIFVPGVTDPATVAALVERIDAPINAMVGPGAPGVAELSALGVARISLGSSVAQAALGGGGYGEACGAADYGMLNALLKPGRV